MIKPIFHLLFLALTFSAANLQSQTDSVFNRETYAWEPAEQAQPNIDSIASSVLINALTAWDYPEFFQPFGFKKIGNSSIQSLIGVDTGTLVQIDVFANGIASVSLIFSHWGGYWEYKQTKNGWEETNRDHQSPSIPQIDDRINPMLWGLYTARLQSELKWLQGPEFQGVIDSLEKIAGSIETLRIQEIQIQSIWDSDFETPSTEWYEGEKAKVNADAAKSELHDFATLVAGDTILAGMYGGRIEQIEIEGDTATVIFWPEKPGIQVASLPFKPISSNAWQLQVRLKAGEMLFINNAGEVDAFDPNGYKLDKDNQKNISAMLTEAASMIPF